MSAVTYSNTDVEQYIEQHFVPVQINVVEHPEMPDLFGAPWTPTIIVEDADGQEYRRLEGFYDPHRFEEELALARVKAALDQKDFANARNRVAEALHFTRGDPQREPETLYWSAVVDYKTSHNAEDLKKGWNELLQKFPDSEWAHKAEVIRG
ncbi:MAG TPA: thioredoxin family protein [Planctomycetota bacterium]|nr:thioredoxin family protein [Planctomycetota bacterium]